MHTIKVYWADCYSDFIGILCNEYLILFHGINFTQFILTMYYSLFASLLKYSYQGKWQVEATRCKMSTQLNVKGTQLNVSATQLNVMLYL